MGKTTIQLQRRGHRLEAMNPIQGDLLEEFPEGVDLNVTITRARSTRQNGMYWGLLNFIVQHGPEWMGQRWPTKDELSDALQLEVGFVRQIKLGNGITYAIPASKNFEECSQARFNVYFEAAHAQLVKWCNYDPLPYYKQWLQERHMGAAA